MNLSLALAKRGRKLYSFDHDMISPRPRDVLDSERVLELDYIRV